MSENNTNTNPNQKPKIFVDSFKIKSRQAPFGQVIGLGIHVDSFIQFLTKYKNEAGYVNVDILPRKEISKYNETHYGVLDNFIPKNKNNNQPEQKKENKSSKTSVIPVQSDDTDF